jgi:hypothetical protein
MNNWCFCWFFTHISLGILIFKGLTARHLYKSFGIKGLTQPNAGLIVQCHGFVKFVPICVCLGPKFVLRLKFIPLIYSVIQEAKSIFWELGAVSVIAGRKN